jgi:hypothetical protein
MEHPMAQLPPVIDYTSLTEKKLRDLMARYTAAGFPDYAEKCAAELGQRGKTRKSDYGHIKWNQTHVREVMQPFAHVAAAVPGNSRTSYTEAGGTKIGRKKTDPEWNWIDSYSGIGLPGLSAVFVCYVKAPGADPQFQLRVNGDISAAFTADELPKALAQWENLAQTGAI